MSAQCTCFIYEDGTLINADNVLGIGLDGIVVRRGKSALKVPKLSATRWPDGTVAQDGEQAEALEAIAHERSIYDHLRDTPGVAKYNPDFTSGILLELYEVGSLEEYMRDHAMPSTDQRHNWISQIVSIVCCCHEKQVLFFDIALRNFLLTKDLDIKIVDFAQSSIVQGAGDLAAANIDGLTTKVDMLHLAYVIYSISTWQKQSVDCADESEWPVEWPELDGSPWDMLILRCWTRQYKSAEDLRHDLATVII